MLLLEIVGITSMDKIFDIAFTYHGGEKEDKYT